MTQSPSLALAALCSRTLDGLKAENIVTLDLRGVDSSPSDFFVICSATSDVHARALNDALTRTTVSIGERRPRSEGRDVGDWVLLDYFDVVVHIFRTESREYYKLEKLWGDAPVVDFDKLEKEELEKKKSSAKKTSPKTTKKDTEESTADKKSEKKPAKKLAATVVKKATEKKITEKKTAKKSEKATEPKAATAKKVSAKKASKEEASEPKVKKVATKKVTTTTKKASTKKSE